MTIPLRLSGLRCHSLFWLGALAAAACSSDEAPATLPAGAAGAASPEAGAAGAAAGPASAGGAAGASGSPALGGAPVSSDAGVGSAPGSGSCTPGETRECSLDLLCSGVETCGPSGSFGSCDCGATELVGSGIVGARCASDADCAGGATCLRADGDEYRGAGGPAGGYCSFPCALEADDCDTHDVQSFCVPLGPDDAGYCIRSCQSLDPDPGEAKCLNRTDVVCVSVVADGVELFNGTRQDGYCRPLCGSDADCPAGRVCHAQAHVCTDAQIAGAPIGARCELDSDCSGYACEDRDSEGVGVCTATCVLGSLSGCGFAREASARGAACITPLVAAGRFSEGIGDLGLCRELCDVPEDCEQADNGWGCAPISPDAVAFFGRGGACAPD